MQQFVSTLLHTERRFLSRSLVVGLLFVTAIVVDPSHANAQGGPPMLTDDTGTPGDGKWENNIALTLDMASERRVIQTPIIDLNYGYGERIQLNFQVGLISRQKLNLLQDIGLTQEVFGAKIRCMDAKSEKEGISVSTYPKIGFRGPGSSANHELTPDEPQWQLPVEVMWALGDVAVTSEIGQLFSKGSSLGWFYGLEAGYSGINNFKIMVELHGQADNHLKQTNWLINFGSRIELSDSLDIIVSMGRFIKSEEEPEIIAYGGVTLHL